jgi:hypothetical protein
MAAIAPLTAALAALAVVAVVTTVPYALTAIDYRRRDNGLAYLLFVSGVGVWNAMFAVQLLAPEPAVKVFFLALSVVGAVLAGLGWFLFASTASSTSQRFNRQSIYVTASVLGGLDIALAVTAPVHDFYWVAVSGGGYEFATITPGVGYWLHTALLAVLFGVGAWLFRQAWRQGINVEFSRMYAVVGAVVVLAIVGSNVLWPGGRGIAPLAAASLMTIGWFQATRGEALRRIRVLF